MGDIPDKRRMLTRIFDEVDSDIPYDVLLYTDEQFRELTKGRRRVCQPRQPRSARLLRNSRSRAHNGRDSRRYYDWLEHASQDLIAAKILSEDDRCYRLSAFHCQQAIEKALKAYILLKSDVLVDGHNLTWLCRQAKKYDKGFHQWFDESADLNQCYVETRYPADIEREYTYKMVKNFYRMAKEMYQYIFAEIDREFDRREKAEEGRALL